MHDPFAFTSTEAYEISLEEHAMPHDWKLRDDIVAATSSCPVPDYRSDGVREGRDYTPGKFTTMKWLVIYFRVYKTDHNAKLKSDILTKTAKDWRKTTDKEVGECEESIDHSGVHGISGRHNTVFRHCLPEEPGTSQPRTEWSTSRTKEYAVRHG